MFSFLNERVTNKCYVFISDLTTYDKSSLSQKWRDLSSKENMELEDDDYYNYYEYEERKRPKNRATMNTSDFLSVLSLSYLIVLASRLSCRQLDWGIVSITNTISLYGGCDIKHSVQYLVTHTSDSSKHVLEVNKKLLSSYFKYLLLIFAVCVS